MFDDFDELLDVICVMQILGIGRNTALKLLGNGEIPAKKVGRQWRILKSDLESYLRNSEHAKVK